MKKSYIKPEINVVPLVDNLCGDTHPASWQVDNDPIESVEEPDDGLVLTSRGHDFTTDWGWEWD